MGPHILGVVGSPQRGKSEPGLQGSCAQQQAGQVVALQTQPLKPAAESQTVPGQHGAAQQLPLTHAAPFAHESAQN
jgi:hypothetical protein